MRALRVEAGMSGSDFCDGLSLAGFSLGCKEDSEPVVVEVGEASSGAFDVFDLGVGGLGAPVVGSGFDAGVDLIAPACEGDGEALHDLVHDFHNHPGPSFNAKSP